MTLESSKVPKEMNPEYKDEYHTVQPVKQIQSSLIQTSSRSSMQSYGSTDTFSDDPTIALLGQEPMIPYATSFLTQLRVLSRRTFYNFSRNVYLMPVHYISAIIMGVLLGAVRKLL